MARKKKEEIDEEILEDEEFLEGEDEEEPQEINEDDEFLEELEANEDEDEKTYDNSLQVAAEIHTQSDILKKSSPQISKEVRYSRLDRFQQVNIFLRSQNYQNWNYAQKLMELGEDENNEKVENHINLYDCNTIEDLKLFFEQNQEKQTFQIFMNLSKERQKAIIEQLNFVREQGLVDSYYTFDNSVNDKFIDYKNKHANLDIEKQVDEVGYVNNILTTAETARAYGGYERNAINTSISVTKDVSETKEEEEVKKKNLFGAMLDKFKN